MKSNECDIKTAEQYVYEDWVRNKPSFRREHEAKLASQLRLERKTKEIEQRKLEKQKPKKVPQTPEERKERQKQARRNYKEKNKDMIKADCMEQQKAQQEYAKGKWKGYLKQSIEAKEFIPVEPDDLKSQGESNQFIRFYLPCQNKYLNRMKRIKEALRVMNSGKRLTEKHIARLNEKIHNELEQMTEEERDMAEVMTENRLIDEEKGLTLEISEKED